MEGSPVGSPLTGRGGDVQAPLGDDPGVVAHPEVVGRVLVDERVERREVVGIGVVRQRRAGVLELAEGEPAGVRGQRRLDGGRDQLVGEQFEPGRLDHRRVVAGRGRSGQLCPHVREPLVPRGVDAIPQPGANGVGRRSQDPHRRSPLDEREQPTWREEPAQPAQPRRLVAEVVEHHRRPHEFRRSGAVDPVGQVGAAERDPRCEVESVDARRRPLEHRRRGVEGDDLRGREPLGQQAGADAGSGADVEDAVQGEAATGGE